MEEMMQSVYDRLYQDDWTPTMQTSDEVIKQQLSGALKESDCKENDKPEPKVTYLPHSKYPLIRIQLQKPPGF